MMLHIYVADLELSLAACVRHMSIAVVAFVLLFSDLGSLACKACSHAFLLW